MGDATGRGRERVGKCALWLRPDEEESSKTEERTPIA